MRKDTTRRFTVISNDAYLEREKENLTDTVTPPGGYYHTNPIYERLLNFEQLQKKKRFTVEDLLR